VLVFELELAMKGFRAFLIEYSNSLKVGWFLASRQIRHAGKGTTALIVFIMALTFLNLVVVSGLLVGLITGSFQQYRESYSGDVIITPAARREYIENSQNLVKFIEGHPSVETWTARYSTGAQVLGTLDDLPDKETSPNSIGARLTGINIEKEEAFSRFSRFVKYGNNLTSGSDGGILIGASLLKKYSTYADANIPGLNLLENVDVESRVRATFDRGENGKVSREFVVKGILKSKIDEISARMFITDSELKRLMEGSSKDYNEIAIRTVPGEAQMLVNDIEDFMRGYDVRVQTYEQAIPSFLRDIETTMNVLGNALSSIALIVASITMFIVIFINAVTKRKFIGIMKGIGISPHAIQIAYVFQAFFYGLVGSAVGLIITFGFLRPWFDRHPIDFPFSDGILVATPGGAFFRVLILLAVTLVAGYVPAKLIVRRNTLDAILGR